jgi:hypothetical protein
MPVKEMYQCGYTLPQLIQKNQDLITSIFQNAENSSIQFLKDNNLMATAAAGTVELFLDDLQQFLEEQYKSMIIDFYHGAQLSEREKPHVFRGKRFP